MKQKCDNLEGKGMLMAFALSQGWRREVEPLEHWLRGEWSPLHLLSLIDKNRIALRYWKALSLLEKGSWEACFAPDSDYDTFVPGRASYAIGPTLEVAALRCYLLNHFGPTVELPEGEV